MKIKIGDKVTRRWKPALGVGEVMHVLGETIVVKWTAGDKPDTVFESAKHLRKVDAGR